MSPFVLLLASFALSSGLVFATEVQWDERGMPSQIDGVPVSWNRKDHFKRNIAPPADADARLLQAITQIQNGANEYRAQDQAADWVATTGWKSIDSQDMRQLTERFGVGFAGEVFTHLIESRPENKTFVDLWQSYRGHAPTPSKWGGLQILVVPGFGVGSPEPKDPRGSRTTEGLLLADLRRLGYAAESVGTQAYGSPENNSKHVERALRARFARPEPLVIFAMSRGLAETVMALGRICESDPTICGRDGQPSRVKALVAIDGLVKGSVVADWVYGQGWVAPVLLRPIRRLAHHVIGPIVAKGLKQIGRLPLVVELLSQPAGDGLAEDLGNRLLQNLLMRVFLNHYGPNDGILEVADTVFPDGIFDQRYTMVVRASHGLLDGNYRDLDMRDANKRLEFVSALMHALRSKISD